jgi:hypothetical protein
MFVCQNLCILRTYFLTSACGLYYKNITVVNDTSRDVTLLENIYSTGVTDDDFRMIVMRKSSYVYSTGH